MNIGEITRKMIESSRGNHRDINHFLKVCAYARAIGLAEGLEARTQRVLEIAAVLHDIACPLCREKYGQAAGHLQEVESPALLADFLADAGLTEAEYRRVVFLVSHHHTCEGVEGLDWRILLEADYLVNADEGNASAEAIRRARERVFRTPTGIALLESVFQDRLNAPEKGEAPYGY